MQSDNKNNLIIGVTTTAVKGHSARKIENYWSGGLNFEVMPGVGGHTFNSALRNGVAGKSLSLRPAGSIEQVLGHPKLHRETLSYGEGVYILR